MIDDVVSRRSADLFARRVRRDRWRRRATVAGILAIALLLAWSVTLAPWARVRSIIVVTSTGSAFTTVDEPVVRSLALTQQGRPLLWVDTTAVRRAVRAVPHVRTAVVTRSWTGELRVVVTERTPVAALPTDGGGYDSVDEDGVVVAHTLRAPARLPVLHLRSTGSRGSVLKATLAVRRALPSALRQKITSLGATSVDGIWFRLGASRLVLWGSSAQSDLKLTALTALQSAVLKGSLPTALPPATPGRPGLVLDVSSPSTPAVRRPTATDAS